MKWVECQLMAGKQANGGSSFKYVTYSDEKKNQKNKNSKKSTIKCKIKRIYFFYWKWLYFCSVHYYENRNAKNLENLHVIAAWRQSWQESKK